MVSENPITQFKTSVERAGRQGVDTVPAALATVDADGRPSIRIVLVRGVDERGFVFHTNYASRKGHDLAVNPNAALTFHWPALEEQIRIEGVAEKLSADESDAYFASRPRGHQIGAWASLQSQVLHARADLEQRYRDFEERFAGTTVPRPPNWGGFRISPRRIEFWNGRQDRLHDRVQYLREGHAWRVERLFP